METWKAFLFYDCRLLPIYAGGKRGAAAAAIVATDGAAGIEEQSEYLMSIPLKKGREIEWEVAMNRLTDVKCGADEYV